MLIGSTSATSTGTSPAHTGVAFGLAGTGPISVTAKQPRPQIQGPPAAARPAAIVSAATVLAAIVSTAIISVAIVSVVRSKLQRIGVFK